MEPPVCSPAVTSCPLPSQACSEFQINLLLYFHLLWRIPKPGALPHLCLSRPRMGDTPAPACQRFYPGFCQGLIPAELTAPTSDS